MDYLPLFSIDYLHSIWKKDFDKYCEETVDETVLSRLKQWAQRDLTLTESQTENVFIQQFFDNTWNYWGTGVKEKEEGFCFQAQYGVDSAGQTGGRGSADLALGWWGRDGIQPVPQVLCEFKDIRSGLDAKQKRKGNDRSPVKQCFDYLKHAFDQTDINSTLTPSWGIVTDMNEFRLYYRKAGDASCQVFVIDPKNSSDDGLLREDDKGKFNRFLFWKIFQKDTLLADFGRSQLEKTLENQWVLEKELEEGFYLEYKAYRERVYDSVVKSNPDFKGTRGKLVKLTQRFLDRCIFILFCEDMGKTLDFPENLLRDMLIEKSKDKYYSADGGNIWDIIKQLFTSMRDGGVFPPNHNINKFNGGLFEEFSELEDLKFPNYIFCAKGQGENHESLFSDKMTLLYLAANYNFGAHGSSHERTITLYALGRVFEQSITELEYMEAKAEGRKSLTELSKRKRDGVYYTPEWVTAYVVKETIGTRLDDIKDQLGIEFGCEIDKDDWLRFKRFFKQARNTAQDNQALVYYNKLVEYQKRLNSLTILDPSCGSGAFLIQSLRFLMVEQKNLLNEFRRVSGEGDLLENWEEGIIRSILTNNLYGVDINPESVEITQLALWLNTALPGKPLSNLDAHIRCGNSLVGTDFNYFYNDKQGMAFDEVNESAREIVNVFDWNKAFPEIFSEEIPQEDRGFDCIVGNPPYVKLQHFKDLQPDVCDYLATRNNINGSPLYESTRTGSFDLYLVFIEKGIELLNKKGRMGYIAPSLWIKNEYGLGLRKKIKRGGSLERWIDFKCHQVFKEATTYTSLQFFTSKVNTEIKFYYVPDGEITTINWDDNENECSYKELTVDKPWNLFKKSEKPLLNRLLKSKHNLSKYTSNISVGIQTSANEIFHFKNDNNSRLFPIKSPQNPVVLDSEIIFPLIKGSDVKRYIVSQPDHCILIPYELMSKKLLSQEVLESRYPKTWSYLKKHEDFLRHREKGKMNDDNKWWGFNYPKNLDKQQTP